MWEFPESWEFGHELSGWIDDAVDWVVVNGDPIFDFINIVILRYLMGPIEDLLLWLPWWLLVAGTGVLAWRIVGWKIGSIVTVLTLVLAFLGLFDLAMQTLAIVLVATVIAVGLGLPLGILGAKSNQFDAAIRPVLDGMQTLPSFVYLVPAIMLFGLGKTPAVMAVVIYSIPPIIRLTNLGIRQVDPEVVEAARSFGSTSRQILAKVQLPMALPTVMAGVNQTIMMALAMVVIASMIGAKGLGVEVLNGIARLEVGRGFLGGLGIVIMAVVIDRITQGLAKTRQRASD
ncbi:MAG: ABC transporter permease subunit [Dehalococcoidia bacterium]|jgi:glycine betaine/proline transport system permease protein|nr:ABC transporter permease subunit [Dehalococcoidia bacterium]